MDYFAKLAFLFQYCKDSTVYLKSDPMPSSRIRFVDDRVWVLGKELQIFDEDLVPDAELSESFSCESIVDVLQLPNHHLLVATETRLAIWKTSKNISVTGTHENTHTYTHIHVHVQWNFYRTLKHIYISHKEKLAS